ncbi:hypothetical protein L2E82_07344 [Cichorium intybus]|uniref:Uncharacterized protein n=1 Tax=Cichorium intybus TaxID=13427 RepID=A0ACB9G581_CICIN|nr:hypothetical protein L2E82_07344 [Cichorium intybus]
MTCTRYVRQNATLKNINLFAFAIEEEVIDAIFLSLKICFASYGMLIKDLSIKFSMLISIIFHKVAKMFNILNANIQVKVAGGDGTVGWVLGCLGELHNQGRDPVPATAIIPLATGNDFSRSFGWVFNV